MRTSISACLLVLLFSRIDLLAVWEIIAAANLLLLAAVLALMVLLYFLCLLRWRIVLGAAGIRFPLSRLLVPFLGGTFMNTFLPSTVGGDILRSAHVARDSRQTAGSVASVLMDRLSGFTAVVCVAVAGLLIGGRSVANSQVIVAVALMALALAGILLVVFHPRVHVWLSGLLSAGRPGKVRKTLLEVVVSMHGFRSQLNVLRRAMLLSLFVQAVSPLAPLLVCWAVGGSVNPVYFFVLMPVIGAISLLPVSIGGIGLRDALVVYAFSRAGLSGQTAMAMSLVTTAFTIALACASGIIYVFALYSRRVQSDQA